MIKKVLNIALWAVIVYGIAWVTYWANQKFNTQKQQGIHISTASFGPQNLIDNKDIKARLAKTADSIYLSNPLSTLAIDSIEKLLSLDANLANVSTYIGVDGKVYVNTSARQMCLRVFDKSGHSFYISHDAKVVNPKQGHGQRCLVVNGHVPHISDKDKLAILQLQKPLPKIYQQLLSFSQTIAKDDFLSALVAQVYVETETNIILSPRTGVNSIIFGDFNNIDQKLQKLKAFYTNSKHKVDWQAYKALNLKYKDQVVCIKK